MFRSQPGLFDGIQRQSTGFLMTTTIGPMDLQGRVSSVYMPAVYLGMVAGAGTGGLIARHGDTAPFWSAFAGSGIVLTVIWRDLEEIVYAS